MGQHNIVGQEGEDMAVRWLQEHGFGICHRNWRLSHYEIDIVATKGRKLHFIEVKTRHYSAAGHPEDSVGKQKFRNLQRAANYYLLLNPGHQWIQFDVLAITLFRNKDPEYFLIEDISF